MNLDKIISDSVKYPLQDIKKLVILFLLTLSGLTLILLPLSTGYRLRIIEETAHGSDELPAFNEWLKMFIDGLRYLVLGLAYLIIPIILFIISVLGGLASFNNGINVNAFIISIIIGIVGLVLYIIFYLIFIMASGNMAYEGRFNAGFNFSKVIGFIRGIGWFNYFIYSLVWFVVGILISMISQITIPLQLLGWVGIIITLIVSIFIGTYLSMYDSRFFGLMYRLALKEDHEDNLYEDIEKAPENGSENNLE